MIRHFTNTLTNTICYMYNNNAVDDILLIIQLFYERNVFARCGKNAAEHDDITPNTAAVIGCLAVTSSQWDEAV